MSAAAQNEARLPKGQHGGGQWTKGGAGGAAKPQNAKAARALATHKPSTKEKQDLATAAEKKVAKLLGGEQTGDNLPVDVIVKTKAGKLHGVEVKSVSDNGNNKITMHPESLARKVKWEKQARGTVHTVVVDMRSGWMYYRKGVGSFRLHTLTRVTSGAHMRRLMGIG
jgi:hypothetical protein